ncbi:MAG: hypothetical protein ACREL5_00410 [Gemmatimonadales bacterium]
MPIMALRYGATVLTDVPPGALLELGAILVLGLNADAVLDDLSALIRAWRHNPWCAVALLAPRALRRSALHPLIPDGMRVEAVGDSGDVAAVIRAAVGNSVPSAAGCNAWLASRLGTSTAVAIARAVDPDSAGAGARRALERRHLPPPGYWRGLVGTVRSVATAMDWCHTEAAAADTAGLSVKTLSRRCSRYFGRPWRATVGLRVWEAALELALRHRGLVTASAAAASEQL